MKILKIKKAIVFLCLLTLLNTFLSPILVHADDSSANNVITITESCTTEELLDMSDVYIMYNKEALFSLFLWPENSTSSNDFWMSLGYGIEADEDEYVELDNYYISFLSSFSKCYVETFIGKEETIDSIIIYTIEVTTTTNTINIVVTPLIAYGESALENLSKTIVPYYSEMYSDYNTIFITVGSDVTTIENEEVVNNSTSIEQQTVTSAEIETYTG